MASEKWNSPHDEPPRDNPVLAKSNEAGRPYFIAYYNNLMGCWTDWDSGQETEHLIGWREIVD